MEDKEKNAYNKGKNQQENPYNPGSREWFAFEDGKKDDDKEKKDNETRPGLPPWA